MPRFSLASRDRVYFELFERAGANVLEAATLLHELLSDFPDHGELATEIRELEHEGDRITHEVVQRLNHSPVAPADRADILALASSLDDIVDYVEEVADCLGLYKIEAPMEQAIVQARVLRDATAQIAEALARLRASQDVSEQTVEVNRLENEGDRVIRDAIAALFDQGIDPIVVIRWKDLFERLESAIDATERAANIIEGIVIQSS